MLYKNSFKPKYTGTQDMKITQEKMSVDTWIKISDNPQQRDTVLHARRALKNHLSEYCETHSRVAAAKLPSGLMYKLDGHTRSHLWDIEMLERPIDLLCDVYHVADKKEAINLYEKFDNAMAVETAGDKVSGAFRLYGITAKSNVFKCGGTTTSLKTIYCNKTSGFSKIDIKKCVEPFVKTLKIIDSGDLAHKNFPAPVFSALLLCVQRDGAAALSFWCAYDKGEGKKTPKSMDAVFCLTEKIRTLREQGEFTRGSNRAVVLTVPKLLVIYEKWGAKLFKKTPKPEGDFNYYIEQYCGDILKKLDRNNVVQARKARNKNQLNLKLTK